MTAATIDERAREASLELRDAFSGLVAPPLDDRRDATTVDLVDGDAEERPGRPRVLAAVAAVAAAVIAFVIGGFVLGGDGTGRVEVAGPEPLTRAEWVELVDTQCRAAHARPELGADDLATLATQIADERAFIALLRATSAAVLDRGVPPDLESTSHFTDDALEALAGTFARAEDAARAGDRAAVDAELQQSRTLGDRIYQRLADAGVDACAP